MKVLSLTLMAIIVTVSALKPSRRIYQGTAADANQFPFMVSIHNNSDPIPICGGAIYNNRWIITAMDCCTTCEFPEITINAGSIHGSKGTSYKIIARMNWGTNLGSLISMLQTTEEIEFNDSVQPINITSVNVTGGEQAVVAGWGGTNDETKTTDVLMYINVTVQDKEECKKIIQNDYTSQLWICGKNNPGQGFCGADLGSPLILNGEMIGVALDPINGCGKGNDRYARLLELKEAIADRIISFNISIQPNEAIHYHRTFRKNILF